MTRTIINLDPEDKRWLDHEAGSRHVAMTELVREAIRDYRVRCESMARSDIETALKRTAGIWQSGDGRAYQDRMRREWDDLT